MSAQIYPAQSINTYKEADSDFDADIVKKFRKLYAIGGDQVVFLDGQGNTVTVLAADYAAINNQAIYVTTIKSTTNCTTLYAST